MIKNSLKFLSRLLAGFVIFTIAWVLLYRFIPIPYTPLMGVRAVQQAWNPQQRVSFHKNWVSIDRISPHLVTAVIAAEDQKFPSHHGFDWPAIRAALAHNSKKTKSTVKGASTISQQTAKNAFLWPHRDWVRKGLEAYFTVLIELLWGKERIMEVYLNIIETGNGIYGAEAAARHYFSKSAAQLNRQEAASIAAILPSPLKWSPTRPGNYTRQRIYWIQRQMNNLGTIKLDD